MPYYNNLEKHYYCWLLIIFIELSRSNSRATYSHLISPSSFTSYNIPCPYFLPACNTDIPPPNPFQSIYNWKIDTTSHSSSHVICRCEKRCLWKCLLKQLSLGKYVRGSNTSCCRGREYVPPFFLFFHYYSFIPCYIFICTSLQGNVVRLSPCYLSSLSVFAFLIFFCRKKDGRERVCFWCYCSKRVTI